MSNIGYVRPAQGSAIIAASKTSGDPRYSTLRSKLFDMSAFAEARLTLAGTQVFLGAFDTQVWVVGNLGRYVKIEIEPVYTSAIDPPDQYPFLLQVRLLTGDTPDTLVQTTAADSLTVIDPGGSINSFTLYFSPVPYVTKISASGSDLDPTTDTNPLVMGGVRYDALTEVRALKTDSAGNLLTSSRLSSVSTSVSTGSAGAPLRDVTSTAASLINGYGPRKLKLLRIQNVGASPVFCSFFSLGGFEPTPTRYQFVLVPDQLGNGAQGNVIELRDVYIDSETTIMGVTAPAQTSQLSILALTDSGIA